MARLQRKRIGGIELLGVSLAGEETVVAAPEYNVCFDVGRAPREMISIDNVCLSHGHMDHAAGVAYYFSQRLFVGNSPGRVILHRSLAGPLQRLMAVWGEIEGHYSPGEVIGVEPLEDVELRRGLLVRPFEVNHCPAALGFTLIEARHKLRPEFFGLPGPRLVELKRQGIDIQTPIELPLVTFTGDTAVGRFLDQPFVRDSQVLLIECTFFDQEHVVRARAGRHLHVADLPRVLEAVPASRIVLIHLTRRTDLRLARRILEKTVPKNDLERISFLMERPQTPAGPGTGRGPKTAVPQTEQDSDAAEEDSASSPSPRMPGPRGSPASEAW
ncbi:MAG TPA: MBL fold metallo-hydrolase [Phycisphaerae bacterium]|nr:MBL fold metallo-hydrolase [Phycisphaerae bacterium]HNU45678.1 MBL fold metallo-hydrolase [Phycisphaerae bacterium]